MGITKKVKRTTAYSRRKRYLDYMGWIKTQPCMCCGVKRNIECAHVGNRAFGQKCSDLETVPLCIEDHRTGKHSHHNLGKGFWSYWNRDRDEMVKKYQALFAEQVGVDEGTTDNNEIEGSRDYDADKKWAVAEYARERRDGISELEPAGNEEVDLCGQI